VEVSITIPPRIFFDQYGSNLGQLLDFGRVQLEDVTDIKGTPLPAGGGAADQPFILQESSPQAQAAAPSAGLMQQSAAPVQSVVPPA
jgi:hypothetical protein